MALASWGQADRRATVGLCCLVGPGVRGIGNRCGLVACSLSLLRCRMLHRQQERGMLRCDLESPLES